MIDIKITGKKLNLGFVAVDDSSALLQVMTWYLPMVLVLITISDAMHCITRAHFTDMD